jgi:hypothetical protein
MREVSLADNNQLETVGKPLRTLWFSVLLALTEAGASAADAPATIYDQNPEHLWNRIYQAIAVRNEGAVAYGIDNAAPFLEPFDDPGKLAGLLDDFLEHQGESRAAGSLQRALFQNDLWAAFDLGASWRYDPRVNPQHSQEVAALRGRLARVIGRLTMSQRAIAELPDNYVQAVKSGRFASDFDPAHPERPFLPPDLFEPRGAWVPLGNEFGEPEALFHTELLAGRSAFSVFIRCPGGREATLAYLDKLSLYPTPWLLQMGLGTRYPDKVRIRNNPLRFDPQTPQFPPGTIVALVRRMMVIDDQFEPEPTRITQTVQFRVYLKVEGGRVGAAFDGRQQPFEFVMRRAALLAARDGGLHAVATDEAEYRIYPMKGGTRAARLGGTVVLSQCRTCHTGDGIFSVNTYTHRLSTSRSSINPQLLAVGEPPLVIDGTPIGDQRVATVDWKKRRFDWGLLRGLIEAENTMSPH